MEVNLTSSYVSIFTTDSSMVQFVLLIVAGSRQPILQFRFFPLLSLISVTPLQRLRNWDLGYSIAVSFGSRGFRNQGYAKLHSEDWSTSQRIRSGSIRLKLWCLIVSVSTNLCFFPFSSTQHWPMVVAWPEFIQRRWTSLFPTRLCNYSCWGWGR